MNFPPLGVFFVEVAAPTAHDLSAGHDPSSYGESSAEWHPFRQQITPVAEYARQAVEQFDYKAEVSGINTIPKPRPRRPGIILIDPWIIAQDDGRAALESAVGDLPRWVLPLLVMDTAADERTLELANKVRDILRHAGALPTHSSRRGAQGVGSPDAFSTVIRVLIAEAELQYVRYGGRYRRSQRQTNPLGHRPGLRCRPQTDGPVSGPDSSEERPNA